jgi:fructose-bisphosphate aldolase class II
MPLVSTESLLKAAVERRSAVAAFNVITLEHVEAVLEGAQAAARPVILQVSENAVRFHGGQVLPVARAAGAAAELAGVDAALHLDHVTDADLLRRAADAGFSSVMFDAGAAPYEQNVSDTAAAVAWAHGAGLLVEAELGYVGGKPGAPASAHAAGVRTDPAEAREYVERTGVDALAVAVGSSHAMTTRDAALDHSLIGELASAVDVPLVLHGSSGVPDDDLRRAVAAGMRKVNVGTALNIAYTGAITAYLADNPGVVDPRKYLTAARASVASTVSDLLRVVSS